MESKHLDRLNIWTVWLQAREFTEIRVDQTLLPVGCYAELAFQFIQNFPHTRYLSQLRAQLQNGIIQDQMQQGILSCACMKSDIYYAQIANALEHVISHEVRLFAYAIRYAGIHKKQSRAWCLKWQEKVTPISTCSELMLSWGMYVYDSL